MSPHDLLSSAEILVSSNRNRPSQVNLRRATSAAYYAMFHCAARCCANSFIGGNGSARSNSAWKEVYRSLDHNGLKTACKNTHILQRFSTDIQDFASLIITMQGKRHEADYDPFSRFLKSAVEADVKMVRTAIEKFETQPLKDKRAFCAHILFKKRA